MKTFKTVLALTTAAPAAAGLFAIAVVGRHRSPDDQSDVGQPVSGRRPTFRSHAPRPTRSPTGQQIALQANFPTVRAQRDLLQGRRRHRMDVHRHRESNASGNAYFSYTVLGGAQKLYAEDVSGDLETEVDTITGSATRRRRRRARTLRRTMARTGRPTSLRAPPAQATKLADAADLHRGDRRGQSSRSGDAEERARGSRSPPANQDAAGHVVFPALSSPYPYRV